MRAIVLATLMQVSWMAPAVGQAPRDGTADRVEPADLALLGGRVVTLDASERMVEALAIRGGRIVAAGSNAEIEKQIGERTQVLRLGGNMVLPGFIETHCHAIGVARDAIHQTYAELSSIAEIQQWIRRRAAELPAGQWIEVPRNEITRLRERRHPTPAELDAACTTHPVLYTSVLKHVLNTAGFRAIGVVDDQGTIPGGEIVRDEMGRPALIRGGTAHIRKLIAPPPSISREATLDALAKLLRRYNEVGITSIFERATDRAGFEMFRTLSDQGRLTTRVTATFRFSARTAEGVEKYVAGLSLPPRAGDDWVRAGPLKITVDGGIHWGTTRLSEPYGPRRIQFYRLTDPNYRGELNYSVDEMRTIFETGTRLGWQMSCHVTGDDGTERVLDAVQAAAANTPAIVQQRFNLIHAYFPSPAIVQRARQLGVCVDTQGYLYYRDADVLSDIYGPAWAERFIGLGEWARGGVPVAINSDHMIGLDPDHAMNSFNPMLMLYIASVRKSDSGRVHGPQQRLSRLDALRSVTAWAAKLSFDESNRGTLEPGKLADLVVIDRDYLNCPEAEIRHIQVLRTIVGGKTVHQRSDRPENSRLPRDNLMVFRGEQGRVMPVQTTDDWQKRRGEIVRGMETVMGKLPGAERRCPLDVKIGQETDCGSYVRRLVTYSSEPGGRVPAYLLVPKSVLASGTRAPAVLCLHPTDNTIGHRVVVGLGGRPNRQYASELAERGFVTLAPSYPLLADYQPNLRELGWESGTLKAVWDNIRGLDLLESLPFVRPGRFGAIGHSLGGHNAVYTAVFDRRIEAVVSSCGLDSYLDYYGGGEERWFPEKGWCQTRYMLRLAEYRGRLREIPFDFHELIGALAPRAVFLSAPRHDSNFRHDSVDRIAAAAAQVYKLYGHPERLRVEHPDCDHDFPDAMRSIAYQLFDEVLH
jgi:predicted amidohydrolase YtcJ